MNESKHEGQVVPLTSSDSSNNNRKRHRSLIDDASQPGPVKKRVRLECEIPFLDGMTGIADDGVTWVWSLVPLSRKSSFDSYYWLNDSPILLDDGMYYRAHKVIPVPAQAGAITADTDVTSFKRILKMMWEQWKNNGPLNALAFPHHLWWSCWVWGMHPYDPHSFSIDTCLMYAVRANNLDLVNYILDMALSAHNQLRLLFLFSNSGLPWSVAQHPGRLAIRQRFLRVLNWYQTCMEKERGVGNSTPVQVFVNHPLYEPRVCGVITSFLYTQGGDM